MTQDSEFCLQKLKSQLAAAPACQRYEWTAERLKYRVERFDPLGVRTQGTCVQAKAVESEFIPSSGVEILSDTM